MEDPNCSRWVVAKSARGDEADTEEGYLARRRLVELLVAGITVDRKEDGSPRIEITYRFGPPREAAGEMDEEMFVGSARNVLTFTCP